MKVKYIAAFAATVLAVGGGAWVGLGSATATATQPNIHGWPAAAGTSASQAIASTKAGPAGSQVLLLRGHTVRHANIDVGGDGFGPGDYFMFEEQLRYLHNDQVVGRDSVRCTAGPTSFICDGTMVLFGKGKVTIYGAGFERGGDSYAVTGGTGVYRAVGGQLTVGSLRGGDDLLAFEIVR